MWATGSASMQPGACTEQRVSRASPLPLLLPSLVFSHWKSAPSLDIWAVTPTFERRGGNCKGQNLGHICNKANFLMLHHKAHEFYATSKLLPLNTWIPFTLGYNNKRPLTSFSSTRTEDRNYWPTKPIQIYTCPELIMDQSFAPNLYHKKHESLSYFT